MDQPKKGILIIAHPSGSEDEGHAPLSSPESSDSDEATEPKGTAECGSCYAFQPSTGRCLRFPPHGSEWSMVNEDDYCCEYKAGPQHEPQEDKPSTPMAGQQQPGSMMS